MTDVKVLQNRVRAWGFLQSEANWARSRDRVTLDGSSAHGLGKTYHAGLVLAKLTSGGKYVPAVHSESDGSQTAVAVLGEDVTIEGDVIVGVIARDAEVRREDLNWDASVSANSAYIDTQVANLAGENIIVRVQGGVDVGA